MMLLETPKMTIFCGPGKTKSKIRPLPKFKTPGAIHQRTLIDALQNYFSSVTQSLLRLMRTYPTSESQGVFAEFIHSFRTSPTFLAVSKTLKKKRLQMHLPWA